jgi:chemotaxis protein MotB
MLFAGPGTDEEISTRGWRTTFNDLLTLLLVFFVMLFALSSMDMAKMKRFRQRLQGGEGVLQGQRSATEGDAAGKTGTDSALELDNALAALGAAERINVTRTPRGDVLVTLPDAMLFDEGRAEVRPEGQALIVRIAAVLARMQAPLQVEGHTDNRPIRNERFASNWELSTARAVNVLKAFIATGGIAPTRLSAVGYGDSRPVIANDTPEARARNRRVEIVLAMAKEK